MQLALSQVCSLASPLDADFADYAAGKCPAIELWLTKLDSYLQSHTVAEVRGLARRHGIALAAASFQGGLFAGDEARRGEAWQLFDRRLRLCQELEVPTLVVACDVPTPVEQADLDRVRAALAQAAEQAAACGVRLALEPQARAALGNNLQTVAALVAQTGSPHLGICLDVFHYYLGPSKPEDLRLLHRGNLFHVQLADLADTPRELAADRDRILPGDGGFHWAPILDHLRWIEYEGYVSVELMNPQLWQIAPRQLSEIAITALRSLLGRDDARDASNA